MIRPTALLSLCMTLLAGCVNFQYDGGTEEPGTEEVVVFSQADSIRSPYRVFGKATVSGDYTDISRDRLIAKLKSEAEAKGADAILITEQEVLPEPGSRSVEPRFSVGADYDGDAGSMRLIQRGMDLTYGCYRDPMENEIVNTRYLRVLKAEFLKYTDGKPRPAEVVEPAPGK